MTIFYQIEKFLQEKAQVLPPDNRLSKGLSLRSIRRRDVTVGTVAMGRSGLQSRTVRKEGTFDEANLGVPAYELKPTELPHTQL